MAGIKSWLRQLLLDQSGNVILMTAGALVPMLALIGGGLDMSRAYMASTQLQAACDAGALAGRRAMGRSGLYGEPEKAVAQRMFNANFDATAIGARDASLNTVSNDQGQVSGTAVARMPTVIMHIFGTESLEITASCMAELQVSNTDVMFVLDTTGSMAGSRIAGLREAVKDFHRTMNEAVTADSTRVRYGFAPYSMTVNVSGLMADPETPMPVDYFADSAPYQSREALFNTPVQIATTVNLGTRDETYPIRISSSDCSRYGTNTFSYNQGNPQVSGTAPETVVRKTYAFKSWSGGFGSNRWCTRSVTTTETSYVTKFAFSNWRYKLVTLDTSRFKIGATVPLGTSITMPSSATPSASESFTYADQSGYYDMVTMAKQNGSTLHNVGLSNTVWSGCIEERDTVAASIWDPIPTGAHDLDLINAPVSEGTRWRPQWERLTFTRSYFQYFDSTANYAPAAHACPAPMQLFTEVDLTGDPSDVPAWLDSYLQRLVATGNTYHDIGMIWGGRMSSPRGIFAENVNAGDRSVSRHLIFMSDGQMEPNIGGYNAYGIEALSNRIAPFGSSTNTVAARHRARFRAACEAVKAEGITVWVVAFGTTLTNDMQSCASDGRAFYAGDVAALQEQFKNIAAQVANLRLGQ